MPHSRFRSLRKPLTFYIVLWFSLPLSSANYKWKKKIISRKNYRKSEAICEDLTTLEPLETVNWMAFVSFRYVTDRPLASTFHTLSAFDNSLYLWNRPAGPTALWISYYQVFSNSVFLWALGDKTRPPLRTNRHKMAASANLITFVRRCSTAISFTCHILMLRPH